MLILSVILFSANFLHPIIAAPLPGRPDSRASRNAATEKVWTNQDIPFLRENAPISIIGGGGAYVPDSASKTSANAPSPMISEMQQQNPHWYAAQAGMLQQRLDADEGQIRNVREIREAGDGISGAVPLDKNAPGLSPEVTIEILQNDERAIRARMDQLEDSARANGLDPGVLR